MDSEIRSSWSPCCFSRNKSDPQRLFTSGGEHCSQHLGRDGDALGPRPIQNRSRFLWLCVLLDARRPDLIEAGLWLWRIQIVGAGGRWFAGQGPVSRFARLVCTPSGAARETEIRLRSALDAHPLTQLRAFSDYQGLGSRTISRAKRSARTSRIASRS